MLHIYIGVIEKKTISFNIKLTVRLLMYHEFISKSNFVYANIYDSQGVSQFGSTRFPHREEFHPHIASVSAS